HGHAELLEGKEQGPAALSIASARLFRLVGAPHAQKGSRLVGVFARVGDSARQADLRGSQVAGEVLELSKRDRGEEIGWPERCELRFDVAHGGCTTGVPGG